MSANRIPVNELGGPSLVALIAERLALNPSAPVSGPSSEAAPERRTAALDRPRRYAPDLRTEEGRTVMMLGLWLRAAFVGASLIAIGVVQLFSASTHPVYALLVGSAGVFVARYAWNRVRSAAADADALLAAR